MNWLFEGISEGVWIAVIMGLAFFHQFDKLNKKIDRLQKQISE